MTTHRSQNITIRDTARQTLPAQLEGSGKPAPGNVIPQPAELIIRESAPRSD